MLIWQSEQHGENDYALHGMRRLCHHNGRVWFGAAIESGMCIPNNIQQIIVQIIQHFSAVNAGGQWGHGLLTRNTSGPCFNVFTLRMDQMIPIPDMTCPRASTARSCGVRLGECNGDGEMVTPQQGATPIGV